MASSTGIFDNIHATSDLFGAWSKRKAELDAAKLQPYADLLLTNIVWPAVLAKKSTILEELTEKAKTAAHASQLFVPIWSFNHFEDGSIPARNWQWVHGPPHALAMERGDKNALKVEQVQQKGWRQTVRVVDQDDWAVLGEQSVYRIIKKTDILEELGALFGRNFRVSLATPKAIQESDPDNEIFYRWEYSLNLEYFPRGLPAHFQSRRDTYLARASMGHRRILAPGETLILWKGEDGKRVVLGPPLAPPAPPRAARGGGASSGGATLAERGLVFAPPSMADNSFHYRGCHCGCDDSDDEY